MREQGPARHLTTPRTLLLLEREGRLLLIEGAPHKWWAGRCNGPGGSVESGEDVLAAARREAREETGLEPGDLRLVAVAHVVASPAVLLFVFRGHLPAGALTPTREGTFHWLDPRDPRPDLPLMPDLAALLPALLARRAVDPPLFLVIEHREGGRLEIRGGDAPAHAREADRG